MFLMIVIIGVQRRFFAVNSANTFADNIANAVNLIDNCIGYRAAGFRI